MFYFTLSYNDCRNWFRLICVYTHLYKMAVIYSFIVFQVWKEDKKYIFVEVERNLKEMNQQLICKLV